MSPGTHPLLHVIRRPGRGAALLIAGVVVAAAVAVVVDRAVVVGNEAHAARPGLQRILDRLVTGPGRIAPGVAAYVSGPHGTWVGSAGLADVQAGGR